ncbi:hypothetical protein H6F38_23105 [Paenibacillus sp. EKM208P]|nr:hypothetical protein H6F38_23105 [Paenibacillus sp. EKM208P]
MGQAIVRFGELKLEKHEKGNVNDWLVFSALPYARQHSSGLDGDIVISATPTIEIIDADLDVAIDPQYAYAYSIATDNKLKIAYSKTNHVSSASALDALKCVSIIYELGELTVNGNLYTMITRNSLGEEINRTIPMTLDQAKVAISTFDDMRQVDYGGFVKYELKRDYTVK